MRLRKIKLTGFKSFVDPTSLLIPGNLVGIVGPNGCGKSNIIDAVTWVMGESSAKHLRGEALTDVIFNGSSARQPVGQALVELLFDNSEGKAGGQYASYNEISIKRQINREGISVYYLNGTRCRRKDIHGLFLGTGLGPRGYSIIEQGMISRLIEAKPDELRVYIEEAAGISRYREKRRETENRMRHTRDNLERLSDIREELAKQLGHLQRQARAAERYQGLKNDERRLKAEYMALNYRDLKAEITRRENKVRDQETQVEENIAELRTIEAGIEKHREELSAANELFNEVQSDYYHVAGDISQLEQKIEYSNEKISTLGGDIKKVENSIGQSQEQQHSDREKLQALTESTGPLEPKLQGSRTHSVEAYDALNLAENAMQQWQEEWDAYKEADSKFKQQIEVYNARLEHLREGLDDIYHRRKVLSNELAKSRDDDPQGSMGTLDESLNRKTDELYKFKSNMESARNEIEKVRDRNNNLMEIISDNRTKQQKIEGTLAALIAIQKGGVSTDTGQVDDWLEKVGHKDTRRLYEEIDIEPEWTHALETVLGQELQSVIVNDFESTINALDKLSNANVSLLLRKDSNQVSSKSSGSSLLDKIKATGTRVDGVLSKVYIANNLTEAVAIANELSGEDSVITSSGIWIGAGWMRVNQNDEEASVLLREQRIQSLNAENEKFLAEISDLKAQLDESRQAFKAAEDSHIKAEKAHNDLQESLNVLRSEHAEIRGKSETVYKRIEQIEEELVSLQDREETSLKEIADLQASLDKTIKNQAGLDSQKEQLQRLRKDHQERLNEARTMWQETHEQSHEIALQLESLSSQRASLEQAIKRTDIQIDSYSGQLIDLQESLDQVRTPLPEFRKSLEEKLTTRTDTENRLSHARDSVQKIDTQIREKDQSRLSVEQQVNQARSVLEQLRMDSQEIKVRLKTVIEQMHSEQHDPEEILQNLEKEAVKDDWQEKIEKASLKIQRLGPINLAAIDEYEQLNQRKEYLDRQNADLSEALATLENAIKKIDKETRTRFKETFDKLNANLKEMFPILFGGGHAFLEMTGNDLLDTGVAIMARPPGKKNSSIHLLSGGEKAMTAVALVFAIFKLNPAPFCILDEVDTPLDDSNAGRFSELLAKMSIDVQFLVITHNKITMEIAQQLLGVTMQEAGVSRLVTVDIEEAVQMAASA
jgi:chromosome segregation protein